MKYKLSSEITNKNPEIRLDGSKSISNRLLVLQQVSSSPFEIENLSTSDDSVLMQDCLANYQTTSTLNVQNAGTVTRFITAFLCTQDGSWTLNCAEPMKKRPIKILVDVLRNLGAEINYLEQDGYLPLQITGKQLKSAPVEMQADVSSQYISALMMVAPLLEDGLTINLIGEIASKPYLNITKKCMEQCGFSVDFIGNTLKIHEGQSTSQSTIFNESDWSAAAFYYTLLSFSDHESITLTSLFPLAESTQGDAIVSSYFNHLGIETEFLPNHQVRLTKTGNIKPKEAFDFFDQPDMVPAFSLACAVNGYETKFTGVQNLVIKESNRLVAMQNELKKLDSHFTAIDKESWQLSSILKQEKIADTKIDTYHDHRIAMTFGTLGFLQSGIIINDPGVVSKSYINFWKDLQNIGLKIDETI